MSDRPARSPLLFRRWRFPNARPQRALTESEYPGGATTNPSSGEHYTKEEGYGVGITSFTAAIAHGNRHRLAHEKSAQRRLARRFPGELQSGFFVGSWRQGKDVHYDPSEVVLDRDEALRRGKERHQKTIWDFANKTEIEVPK